MSIEALPQRPPAPSIPSPALRTRRWLAWGMLFGPLSIYLLTLWLVSPVSLSHLSPVLLVLTPLAIKVPRAYTIQAVSRLSFELVLLSLLVVLSFLSIYNLDDPIRCIRIIFPCLLPLALLGALIPLGYVSRDRLLEVPRLMVFCCLSLTVFPFFALYAAPSLQSRLIGAYRLECFFENPIQLAIGLGVVTQVMIAEFAISKNWKWKTAWGILLVLTAYTMFRTGSKAPLGFTFLMGSILYVGLKFRSQSWLRSLVTLSVLIGVVLMLAFYGITIAERLNPQIGMKVRSVVEGGISNYHSFQERKLLWADAIHEGKTHWLIGSGAGEKVRGLSHAHNLVLDYFKGVGLFGATAIVLLCLTVLARAASKGAAILFRPSDDADKRIWACYMAALLYFMCNQMSDSFGPSTAGFFWVVYLTAVLADRRPGRRLARPVR